MCVFPIYSPVYKWWPDLGSYLSDCPDSFFCLYPFFYCGYQLHSPSHPVSPLFPRPDPDPACRLLSDLQNNSSHWVAPISSHTVLERSLWFLIPPLYTPKQERDVWERAVFSGPEWEGLSYRDQYSLESSVFIWRFIVVKYSPMCCEVSNFDLHHPISVGKCVHKLANAF